MFNYQNREIRICLQNDIIFLYVVFIAIANKSSTFTNKNRHTKTHCLPEKLSQTREVIDWLTVCSYYLLLVKNNVTYYLLQLPVWLAGAQLGFHIFTVQGFMVLSSVYFVQSKWCQCLPSYVLGWLQQKSLLLFLSFCPSVGCLGILHRF